MPGRLFWLVVAAMAACAVALGVLELATPAGFDDLLHRIQASLPHWPEY